MPGDIGRCDVEFCQGFPVVVWSEEVGVIAEAEDGESGVTSSRISG